MNNSSEQFLNFFKSCMNPENLMNTFKNFQGVDFGSVNNATKKNAELFAEATQIGTQNLQLIAKKTGEAVHNRTNELFNAIKETSAAQDLEQAAASQRNYLKSTFENSVTSAKEILDITSQSSMEVLNKIGEHFAEQITKNFKI